MSVVSLSSLSIKLLLHWSDEPSGVDVGSGAVIHEILWNTDMHSPMMRKLVNETCCKSAYTFIVLTLNAVSVYLFVSHWSTLCHH